MKEFEARYNFYTAMEKLVSFYKGYMETKKTREEIVAEANELRHLFDFDLFVDSEEERQLDADAIAGDIKNLFETPIKSIGDLIDKGYTIMELKNRIEQYEYWYC